MACQSPHGYDRVEEKSVMEITGHSNQPRPPSKESRTPLKEAKPANTPKAKAAPARHILHGFENDNEARQLLGEIFAKLDEDGSGGLDANEFFHAHHALLGSHHGRGLDDSFCMMTPIFDFNGMDHDHSGSVDQTEWSEFCSAAYQIVGRKRFIEFSRGWLSELQREEGASPFKQEAQQLMAAQTRSSVKVPGWLASDYKDKTSNCSTTGKKHIDNGYSGGTPGANGKKPAEVSRPEHLHQFSEMAAMLDPTQIGVEPEPTPEKDGKSGNLKPAAKVDTSKVQSKTNCWSSPSQSAESHGKAKEEQIINQRRHDITGAPAHNLDEIAPPAEGKGFKKAASEKEKGHAVHDTGQGKGKNFQKATSEKEKPHPPAHPSKDLKGAAHAAHDAHHASAATMVKSAAKFGKAASEQNHHQHEPHEEHPVIEEEPQFISLESIWEMLVGVQSHMDVNVCVDVILNTIASGLNENFALSIPQLLDHWEAPMDLTGVEVIIMIKQLHESPYISHSDMRVKVSEGDATLDGKPVAQITREQEIAPVELRHFRHLLGHLSSLLQIEEKYILSQLLWIKSPSKRFEIHDAMWELVLDRCHPGKPCPDQSMSVHEFEMICRQGDLIDAQQKKGISFPEMSGIFNKQLKDMPKLLGERQAILREITNSHLRAPSEESHEHKCDKDRIRGRTQFSIVIQALCSVPLFAAKFASPLQLLTQMVTGQVP